MGSWMVRHVIGVAADLRVGRWECRRFSDIRRPGNVCMTHGFHRPGQSPAATGRPRGSWMVRHVIGVAADLRVGRREYRRFSDIRRPGNVCRAHGSHRPGQSPAATQYPATAACQRLNGAAGRGQAPPRLNNIETSTRAPDRVSWYRANLTPASGLAHPPPARPRGGVVRAGAAHENANDRPRDSQ